ncbi:sushi, von Willebrand factor type A, EGF and pentraxin domain-containing protein 1-like [Branchiostoma floridae]|uniref:Sushi, von Willebrand factor type A, EGF and pentraxin domain-containing protein 1-like n=1 Tax=Branchiostoma floridae TaxID=7739 RepID=A0A9J7M7V0_BRAFL|nr:sushi, von Willebrand factor type A, EGF and pentraxin domain-containing protein 1-like [Branchiostoma floridae]
MACTRSTYYGSICTYECEDGYFPANNSTYIPSVQRSCLASRVWTNTTDTEFSCVDVEAPTFPNCPSPISAQAEKGTVSAFVSWAAPGAEDNSGEDVHVSQTVGQPPGSRFEEGFHTIVYTATDSVMNSANCSFTVTVTTPKCSRLQTLQYASILCDNQYNYGSTCTYTCDEGYFLNGDPTTTCELDLSTDATYWTHSASQHNCQPVQCPQLPSIQNGGWLVNTTCSNTFGSYCYFQCDPGYKLQGDSTVSCKASTPGQSTGVWDGNIPTCIESTCSPLGPIANGRIVFDQDCPFGNVFSAGSVCGVSCSPGHVLIGSSFLTCLLDGTWNASLPSCEVITCDSAGLPTPTNGYKLGCSNSEEPHGTTCILGCNTGYEPAIPVQRTCIADGNGVGQWSNGTINCKEIKCRHLPKPNNGNITACYHDGVRTEPEQSQSVGAVCSTMCNEGYTAAGSAERTCLPGGGWNGTELRCRDLAPPVLQCPDEIILVANEGQDTATVDWHWEPVLANDAGKDIVSALSGSTTRETELPEGRHFFTYEATDAAGNRASCTMAIDVRVIRCPGLPSVVNGVTTLVAGKGTCSGGSVRGSQCEVTCDAGYSMADGSTVTTRTCHRTGNDTLQASWTGPVPVCTAIKCSGLPTVENGMVIPATCLSPSVSNGEICIFNCDPGYSIMGPFSKQCLTDGRWSDTRKTSCKDHEPPRFTGQCPTYVNAIGDAGKTSATVLFTEPAATDNSNYVNVSRAANQRGPGDDFPEGTTVVTYVAKDAANNRAQCDVFVVVRVHRCPMVQAPASGAVNCSGDFYGSKCQYRCNEGYMLDGSPFRHCVLSADGSSSYWNGSQPVCRAVECPALVTPANAVKSGCFNEPPTTERFGTVCSFYCNYGYSGSGVNSARCLSDGTWTSFNFVCENIEKPRFSQCPQDQMFYADRGSQSTFVNWTVSAIDNSGEIPTVTCSQSPAVLPAGDYQVSCTATDATGNTETCLFDVRVKVRRCQQLLPPLYGSFVGTCDTAYGSTCQVTCTAGYQLEGSDTATCEMQGNNAVWDRATNPVCQDITAPTLLTCPGPQYGTITDSSFLGVSVSFDIPRATDNSGETLSITKLPVDITSPYNFTADTVVTYEFRDSGGNSVTCTFMVYIKGELPPNVVFCPDDLTITATDRLAEVSWPEPVFDDPTGGDLDVSANIANNGSLPWGDHSVTYTATNVDNGKSVTCTFLVIVRPVACPPLNPPLHGALACDTWVYGKFCSMFCSAQYDIPRGSNPGDKYICGASGIWSPPPPVPDCVSSFRPNRFVLPSELHYFSGDCSDPSVQADIAQRFVTILNGSDFGSACSDSVGCSWENVEVVCGANSRRRSLGRQSKLVTGQMTDISSRSSGQYLLTMKFSLVVNMTDDDPNLSSVDRYYAADDQLLMMTDVIQAEIYSGDFDVSVPGLSLQVDQNSLTYGWSELDCPKGYAEQPDSMNCVGCPTGTFYDEDADDCLKCSVGYYQDEEGQFQCKTCPLGTSTIDEGARNLTECLGTCAIVSSKCMSTKLRCTLMSNS